MFPCGASICGTSQGIETWALSRKQGVSHFNLKIEGLWSLDDMKLLIYAFLLR